MNNKMTKMTNEIGWEKMVKEQIGWEGCLDLGDIVDEGEIYDLYEEVNTEIDEVGTSVYDWFWQCYVRRYKGNKWLALGDVWFKLERQFEGEYSRIMTQSVCESLKRVMMEEMGEDFWDVDE